MALAFVHMKSRKNFPVLMPWSAAEWAEQIDSRQLGEIPASMLLVDDKGTAIVVNAAEIEFVTLPLPEGEDDGK